jgi:hypothetical protein
VAPRDMGQWPSGGERMCQLSDSHEMRVSPRLQTFSLNGPSAKGLISTGTDASGEWAGIQGKLSDSRMSLLVG